MKWRNEAHSNKQKYSSSSIHMPYNGKVHTYILLCMCTCRGNGVTIICLLVGWLVGRSVVCTFIQAFCIRTIYAWQLSFMRIYLYLFSCCCCFPCCGYVFFLLLTLLSSLSFVHVTIVFVVFSITVFLVICLCECVCFSFLFFFFLYFYQWHDQESYSIHSPSRFFHPAAVRNAFSLLLCESVCVSSFCWEVLTEPAGHVNNFCKI